MVDGARLSPSWDLVEVEPEAIRPVEKQQAVTSPELDASLAQRADPPTSTPALSSSSSSSSSDSARRPEGDDAADELVRSLNDCSVSEGCGLSSGTTTVADGRSGVTKRQCAAPLDAFILHNVVSATECRTLIDCAASLGYSFWNPAVGRTEFRNSDTVEVTSEPVAAELWRRVAHLVVPRVTVEREGKLWERGLEGEWVACGINPHLLFNHYHPGGHFSPHTDGATVVDFNRRSLYSMLVYLNLCPETREGEGEMIHSMSPL